MTAHELVTDLGRAYHEEWLDRSVRLYLTRKLLIIDEMGSPPLDELGSTVSFNWSGPI